MPTAAISSRSSGNRSTSTTNRDTGLTSTHGRTAARSAAATRDLVGAVVGERGQLGGQLRPSSSSRARTQAGIAVPACGTCSSTGLARVRPRAVQRPRADHELGRATRPAQHVEAIAADSAAPAPDAGRSRRGRGARHAQLLASAHHPRPASAPADSDLPSEALPVSAQLAARRRGSVQRPRTRHAAASRSRLGASRAPRVVVAPGAVGPPGTGPDPRHVAPYRTGSAMGRERRSTGCLVADAAHPRTRGAWWRPRRARTCG